MPLRRMVIELNLDDISPLGELLSRFYMKNSSVEILQTLFISGEMMAEIVKIVRKGDFYTLEDISTRRDELLRKYGLLDFEVIDANPSAGYYTAIIKHRPPVKLSPVLRSLGGSVHLASPLEVRKGSVRMTLFVEKDKAGMLAEELGRQGIQFKINSITEAFGRAGKGNGVSPSQLSLVQLANAMGYFEVPRRVTTDEVARIAGVTAPAVSKAIRRVEKSLVERLLRETNML